MYLSRMILNPRSPVALRALGDLHAMHRLIWQAFPRREEGGARRVLYRAEASPQKGYTRVLAQSDQKPCWDAVSPDDILLNTQTKLFTPAFAEGQFLRFRLRANPTVIRTFGEGCARPGRRRLGVYTEAEQRAWLTGNWDGPGDRPAWMGPERQSKAEAGGFGIREMRADDLGVWTGRKPDGMQMQFLSVEYNGVLQVTDPAAFLRCLENGIGSAKGFGFGLLSVAPV
ncbi:MAG: type I-E CRISPR-associated protein Cas6/Cse3/CasE [Armatimonadetes bacterium]|nr:type I-E CRISPR-associated protein Cas6/Cse3/CasE [Armatimonadota bacterium]